MFYNLHVHDAKGSLLDSIMTIKDIVDFAVTNGQSAIAVTNHGYMTSYVDFVKYANSKGIKPIIGNEIYEVDNMFEKADTKDYKQDRYHLILLAKNQTGYKNLIKLTSVACTEGFYKKPLITIDYIKENGLGEGIICSTACQAGRLSRYLENGWNDKADAFLKQLQSTFDDVYCEIQSHNTDEQFKCNKLISEFALERNCPLVVTTDAHMIDERQIDSHAIYINISEDRDVGEMYEGCYLQTEKEVYETLKNNLSKDIITKAIQGTEMIANSIEDIDIGLNIGHSIMPKIPTVEGFESNEDYLRYLVYSTFDRKFGGMSEEEQEIRRNRIETELPVLNTLHYTDYFIMLYMIIGEAKKRGIPLGYSRGSGANCLCLFMLDVTQIDSVRWDLDFSRFANLGRTSTADYDIDVSKKRRKELITISEDLFGKENVAPICTFNTLSTKVAIRDIGRVLNDKPESPYYLQIPYTLRDEVAKMIPTIKTFDDLGQEEEKDILLRDFLSQNSKLKEIYDKFPLWFKYVMDCEGLPKSIGRHAAGTLITPNPVISYCPLCYDSDKNIMVQLEMHNAMDDLSLTKMDYLGLETLDIIDDCLKISGLTWEDVDINHLNLEDKTVFDNVYKTGNTVGIFQMESAEARKMCIEANVDSIHDVIAINAANRPGTKDGFPDYCKNKLCPEEAVVLHDDLRAIFAKTHFILLYQEQALQIFRYAGFPEEEVDNARRAIGKKQKETMESLKEKLYEGLKNKNWDDTQIEGIWDLLLKQANYSFNFGHASSYGLLSYLTAYLKTHYPVEFMTACLTSKSDKVEKISSLISDCKRLNIKVLPPQINYSNKSFTAIPEKNEILFGLLAVKGIGESIIDKIIEYRPYDSLNDFIEKVSDKKAIVTLIKAGALPVNDKMKALKSYAKKSFDKKEYKPVSSYKTKAEMLLKYDIDVDQYKVGNKIDKDRVLEIYNSIRKKKFDEEQAEKYQKHMQDFKEKYAEDEYLWEFQTLSMFLTNDPLEDAYKYIENKWDDIEENEKGVLLCVIANIKRMKDKRGNPYAYLDLYSPYGIVEATIWSKQLKEYSNLIQKGMCLAIKGRKREEGHLFVEAIKTYEQWLNDKEIK